MSHLKRIENKNGRRKPIFDSQTIHFWRKRAYERDYKKAYKVHQQALAEADRRKLDKAPAPQEPCNP